MENLEEELQIMAVKLLWNSLKLIENPSYKVQEEAVKTKGWAIQYIQDPSEELCIVAVEKDYDSIKYIKNPSEEVQLRAIDNYWGAIRFINNPSLRVNREAIIKSEEAIHFINNYDLDDLKIFIGDNINIVKYLYESIEPELVVEVLVEKLEKDDIDEEYMKDFLDLEVLEMDKGKLVWEFGSKRAKKLVVDHILSK